MRERTTSDHGEGAVEPMTLRVEVKAGARRESVQSEKGMLLVSVRNEARHNDANRRVVALVAARYGVPVASVRILTGARSPRKTLEVRVRAPE